MRERLRLRQAQQLGRAGLSCRDPGRHSRMRLTLWRGYPGRWACCPGSRACRGAAQACRHRTGHRCPLGLAKQGQRAQCRSRPEWAEGVEAHTCTWDHPSIGMSMGLTATDAVYDCCFHFALPQRCRASDHVYSVQLDYGISAIGCQQCLCGKNFPQSPGTGLALKCFDYICGTRRC